MVKFRVRLMEEKDFEAVRKIKEANTLEYLEFLRKTDPRLYSAEVRESRAPAVDADLFNLYLESGSSFVAEVNGQVVGFVFSQTIEFMHGERRMMWIEYIGVQTEHRLFLVIQGRGIRETTFDTEGGVYDKS